MSNLPDISEPWWKRQKSWIGRPLLILVFLGTWFAFLEKHDGLLQLLTTRVKVSDHVRKMEAPAIARSHSNYLSHVLELPSTYEKLLLQQNPRFVEELRNLQTTGCGFLLVYAPAGYGKSGLINPMIHETLPDRDILEVDCRKFAESLLITNVVADLMLAETVVNNLPVLDESGVQQLVKHCLESKGSLITIDSLDEVHKDSVRALLRVLKANRSRFGDRDVVLQSRPEVVDELESEDRADYNLAGVAVVGLAAHQITSNALRLRVVNFLNYQAQRSVQGGAQATNGIILNMNDPNTVDRVTKSLAAKIKKHPELTEMLRLAVLSRLLIKAEWEAESSLGNTIEDIRSAVRKAVLDRNTDSHKRPSNQNQRYYNALIAIACAVVPDENGYFTVPSRLSARDPNDSTKFFDFKPYNVLSRSGLVSLSPAKGNARMRFEPVWLQGEFAESSDEFRGLVPNYGRIALYVILPFLVCLGFASALIPGRPSKRARPKPAVRIPESK